MTCQPNYTAMQAAAVASMLDECTIAVGAAGGDFAVDPGTAAAPSSFGSATACGFKYTDTKEKSDGTQTQLTDAMVRLPLGTVVNSSSRVKLTKRHGSALATPQIFAVVGVPEIGPSCLVLKLKYAGPGGAV